MTVQDMNDSRARSKWLALAVLAVAQFMVVLDVTIVNVALPAIQTDLGFTADGLQWVVNALHARLRRPAAAGWPRGRPARSTTALPHRPRAVRRRFARRRVRRLLRDADRRPRDPGHRRRAALARRARAADRHVPRRQRAQHRARHLGRAGRHRRHARRRRRRRARRLGRLGVDLLRQRPGRDRSASSPRRASSPRAAAPRAGFDFTGAVLGTARPARAGLRRHPHRRGRLGLGRGARAVRRRRRPARRVRLRRVARRRPAGAAAALPRARPGRLRDRARAQRRARSSACSS